MNCGTKKLYPNKQIADRYAEYNNNDIFRKDKREMHSYYCPLHKGWHNGHDNEDKNPITRIQNILDKGVDQQ